MRDHTDLGELHQARAESAESGGWTVRYWGGVKPDRPFKHDDWSGKMLSQLSPDELKRWRERQGWNAMRILRETA